MGRHPRRQTAGIYHVWNHVVARTPLFGDEGEYLFRLAQLEEAVRKLGVRCHSVCLMGNHEHLLFTFDEDDRLARVMHRLNRTYARAFNHRNGRRGRVYWSPYGSKPVLSDSYLLELIRYIPLNPEWDFGTPAERYRWSSYGDLLGLRTTMRFVDHGPLLRMFSDDIDVARQRIAQHVADGRLLGRRRVEDRV